MRGNLLMLALFLVLASLAKVLLGYGKNLGLNQG